MTTTLGALRTVPRRRPRTADGPADDPRDRHHGPRSTLDGVGHAEHRHGHRLLRPPPDLARASRPVRPRDHGAGRPPRRRAPHGRGRRARARRRLRRGARRPRRDQGFGDSSVPMDESVATAVLDIGGRPYAVIDLPFRGERVGELPLQLVDHALEAFARTAGATLHLRGTGPQRPPPRRGGVQGARPRAARRLRARPAARRASPRRRARSDETSGRDAGRRPPLIAVVDYGAGNLVSHRAGAHDRRRATSGSCATARTCAEADAARRARASAPRRRRWTASTRGRLVDADRRLDPRRPTVPRHLPRAPAAVRGQRRGRRRDAGRPARADGPPRRTPRRCRTSAGTRSSAAATTRCSPASPTAPTSTSSTPTPASPRATTATRDPRRDRARRRGSSRRSRARTSWASSSTRNAAAATACGSSPTSSAVGRSSRRRARCRSARRHGRRLMLRRRVIPCLDVANGRVVKGTRFVDLVDEGDPPELAARYADEGADELVFLDISAAPEGRGHAPRHRRADGPARLHPAHGGRRRADASTRCATSSAPAPTRSSLNTAAVADPTLITRVRRAVRPPGGRRRDRCAGGPAAPTASRELGGRRQGRPRGDRPRRRRVGGARGRARAPASCS